MRDSSIIYDIALCYSEAEGDGADARYRVGGRYESEKNPPITCAIPDTARVVPKTVLDSMAALFNGVNAVHPNQTLGTHYHIRFQ
jgi:hypothetical protein